MPRIDFDGDIEPETGMIIGFTTPAGDEVPGMVVSTDEETIKVDFNHPLAGHEIRFTVEVVEVKPPQRQGNLD